MHTPQALRRAVTSWIDSVGYQTRGHSPAAGASARQETLQGQLRTLRASLVAALAEPHTTHVAALDGLISLLQFHERDSRGHSRRVARLTMALAAELGVDEGDRLHLEQGRCCTTSASWMCLRRSSRSRRRSMTRSGK